MEYAGGGELFDHIVEQQRVPEHSARKFMRQLVSALELLADRGVAHRDIKPETKFVLTLSSLSQPDFFLFLAFF